jgi:tRNA nucleotidyltransferase (CCA-adding enzyme)
MGRVLDSVRKKVTPTPEERKELEKVIDRAVAVTKQAIKPHGLDYTLAGSFIRDTWMPDKKEFEIFIMFPEHTGRSRLEELGLEVGKKIVDQLNGSYVIAYAEHPYVRARAGGFDLDIVPCYKLRSARKIKSAVDRTPFHNQWIAKNLPASLSSEVRLMKRFTKALGVYGSDTRVQGFSGYLCELLVVHYGSFEALARSAAGWDPGRILIDLQNHHKNTNLPEHLKEDLKQKFKNQPLIVIDPVDPRRNVAAAFSLENFARFTLACERFTKRPTEGQFFPVPVKVDHTKLRKALGARGSKFLLIEFQRPGVIDDVLWPQLRRTGKRLKDIMHEYDFLVLDWAVHSEMADIADLATGHGNSKQNRQVKPASQAKKSYIMLEMGVWSLPKIRKVVGPPVLIKQRAAEFKKKYQKLGRVWVDGDRFAAEVSRDFLDARAKLEDSLSDPLKQLKAKGIASHIAESIAGKPGKANTGAGFKILEEEQVLALARKDRPFGLFLKKYLERDG